ncbi:MAG: peptide deformylase [Gammaproteobacteria bacterium]|nr:peptide deformylase [Gammaproteobacteria bacterium]
MARLELLVYPDTRLRRVAEPVDRFDEALRAFVGALEETMRAGPAAVGIAAPQVGCARRIVIVDASSRPKVRHHGRLVLVNPRITAREDAIVAREGCLSVPDYTGNVERAGRIVLEAHDEYGEERRYEMEGFEARVAQHEIDHLDGFLFIDRLVSRRDLFRRRPSG